MTSLLIAQKLTEIAFWVDEPRRQTCWTDWGMKNLVFDDYDFWVVEKGTGWIKLNDKTHEIAAGSQFLLKPGDRVSAGQDLKDPLTLYYGHFRPEPHPFWEAIEFPGKLSRPSPELPALFERTVDRLSSYGGASPKSPLILKHAYLFEALDILLRAGELRLRKKFLEHPLYERLERILAVIRSRPEEAWTLPALAKIASVDPATVIRTFRRFLGTTPARWILRSRLEKGRQFLESGSSVREAAERTGFPDAYTFSHAFKRCYKLSPKPFLEKQRQPLL